MVRCAVIGCGVIAPTHIEGIREVANAELYALCDLIPERLNALSGKYNAPKRTTDYRELLADPQVDLVHVCTDHASHAQIVIDALNAGKHVLCEKSAGRTDADLAAMSAAVKAHPEAVAAGIFQHRFVPQNRNLRRMIAEGVFGQVLTVNLAFNCLRTNEYYRNDAWRGTIAGEGGGVLINQAIHYLDQLRFLCGEVKAVSARCANQTHQGVIEVEDAAVFTMEFENGALGTVCATNSSVATWHPALTVSGTATTLELIDEEVRFIENRDAALKERLRRELSPEAETKVVGKAYYGIGHTAEIADVCAAIEEHRAPEVPLLDALNSSSLVMAVYESARNNGRRTFVRDYR